MSDHIIRMYVMMFPYFSITILLFHHIRKFINTLKIQHFDYFEYLYTITYKYVLNMHYHLECVVKVCIMSCFDDIYRK